MTEHDLHKIATDQTRDAITRWIEEEEEMIKDGVSSALDFLSDSEAAAVIAIVRGRLLHVEPDYATAALTYQLVEGTAIGHGLMPAVKAIVDAALGIGGSDVHD